MEMQTPADSLHSSVCAVMTWIWSRTYSVRASVSRMSRVVCGSFKVMHICSPFLPVMPVAQQFFDVQRVSIKALIRSSCSGVARISK